MSRSAQPPNNFGSGGTPSEAYSAVRNSGLFSQPQVQPPQRQYTPNPFAAQTPPPGQLPPGMSSGPPNGMTPERWHQYQYMTGKERKQADFFARIRQIMEANRARQQQRMQPTSGATKEAVMAQALRTQRQML